MDPTGKGGSGPHRRKGEPDREVALTGKGGSGRQVPKGDRFLQAVQGGQVRQVPKGDRGHTVVKVDLIKRRI